MIKIPLLPFLFYFIMLSSAWSQNGSVTLAFTSINNGSYVGTDSIIIENLTHPGDTVLHFPDSVLVLDLITGIRDQKTGSESLRLFTNHPNPFTGQTRAVCYLPQRDRVEATIQDLPGKTLARFEGALPPGFHEFSASCGETGVLILRVHSKYGTGSIRMISAPPGGAAAGTSLVYRGLTGSKEMPSLKLAGTGFPYYPGDTLRYTGFGKTLSGIAGSSVILDIPDSDSVYFFEISEGIPCPGISSVIYYGKVYTTRQIGSGCWMRENLNAGVRIDAAVSQSNNGILEKYCYSNNPDYCAVYGALYQWDEAMQYASQQGVQGICPPGWHLPTDAEWTSLSNFLGGESVAGGHLKERGNAHWMPPNAAADNSSGFCALPAGMYIEGGFHHFRYNVEYWSSTNSSGPYAWYRILYNDNGGFLRSNWYEKTTSRSVRCIRD